MVLVKNVNELAVDAIYRNDVEKFKSFIKDGLDINYQDSYFLKLAVFSQYGDLVRVLVDAGANIDAEDGFALRWAVNNEDSSMVEYLLEKGAGKNLKVLSEAFKGSIEVNNLDIAKKLVEHGADVKKIGTSFLHKTINNKNFQFMKFLVDNGADINAFNGLPLLAASAINDINMVTYLVGNGANIHAENDIALAVASKNGFLDVVKYLVGAGGDKNVVRDNANKNVLVWYVESQDDKLLCEKLKKTKKIK